MNDMLTKRQQEALILVRGGHMFRSWMCPGLLSFDGALTVESAEIKP